MADREVWQESLTTALGELRSLSNLINKEIYGVAKFTDNTQELHEMFDLVRLVARDDTWLAFCWKLGPDVHVYEQVAKDEWVYVASKFNFNIYTQDQARDTINQMIEDY